MRLRDDVWRARDQHFLVCGLALMPKIVTVGKLDQGLPTNAIVSVNRVAEFFDNLTGGRLRISKFGDRSHTSIGT